MMGTVCHQTCNKWFRAQMSSKIIITWKTFLCHIISHANFGIINHMLKILPLKWLWNQSPTKGHLGNSFAPFCFPIRLPKLFLLYQKYVFLSTLAVLYLLWWQIFQKIKILKSLNFLVTNTSFAINNFTFLLQNDFSI